MVEQEPCVLIVDDDQGDLQRVERALAGIRLRVVTVRDPHEVLRKVESELPDLVILDALLPGLSGFDLCKQIKTEIETKNTVVVILTGVYLKDHYRREAIHQFKADGFVTKPFRNRELQRLVLMLLAKKLRTSPKELQERLTQNKDILLSSELEEKPNWFGRIFGRLKGAPAESTRSGFLGTAKESQVAEDESRGEQALPDTPRTAVEPASGTGEVVEGLKDAEAEAQGASTSGTAEEPEEKEVEAEPEKEPVRVVEEPQKRPEPARVAQPDEATEVEEEEAEKESPEPLSPPREDVTEGAVEVEPEEKRETSAGMETPEETPGTGPFATEETDTQSRDALDEVPAEPELSTTSPLELDEIGSAKAIFEALGKEEEGEDASVVEEVEETNSGKTMPAGIMAAMDDGSGEPGGSEKAEGEDEDAPMSPPRPRALHEELPIYQEEDYLHELKREVLMCERLGRPITIIMVRIADLDQIVELLGKPFRSKVLLHVAEHALEAIREIDMVGLLDSKELIALTAFASDRYGGEKIVSRLQTALGHSPFEVGVGLPSFIPDLRFGMAVYPREAAGIDEMIESAEAELPARRRSM